MTTRVGKQTDPVALLRALCQLDFDAVEAYEAAIERLDDTLIRKRMEAFCDDHLRHIEALNPIIESLGGVAVDRPDLKRVVTRGRVVVGGLLGDRAILIAMKSNEDDTNTAYERSVSHLGLPREITAVLERHLQDERRHREYVDQALRSLTRLTFGAMSSQS